MQIHAFGDKNRKSLPALHGMLYFHTDAYVHALRATLEEKQSL